jgi:hypothetical protein
MQTELKHRIDRRAVIGTTAAALLAFNAPRIVDAASSFQRAVQGGGGAAGGGTIVLADGTPAAFSVFATRLTVKGEKQPLILGTVLVSAGGSLYVSTQVTNYGPIAGNADGREVTGFMTIDGSGNHPFHVNMPDLAVGSFGTDTFGFTIWDVSTDSEPIFNFEGPLSTGDIQLLDLKFTK